MNRGKEIQLGSGEDWIHEWEDPDVDTLMCSLCDAGEISPDVFEGINELQEISPFEYSAEGFEDLICRLGAEVDNCGLVHEETPGMTGIAKAATLPHEYKKPFYKAVRLICKRLEQMADG